MEYIKQYHGIKDLMKSRKFKKILITGILGSGGSYLAEYINKKNKGAVILGTTRKKNNISKIAKITTLNLKNYNKLLKYIKNNKPDLIFHLASYADVRKSFDNPLAVINNNNNITLNLLEAVRSSNYNPLIIICSSSEVYGTVKKSETPITENQIMRPVSPYAVSKAFQDLVSQVYYKSYKMNIIITRMFSYTNARRFNLFQSSFARQIVKIEKGKQSVLYHGNLKSIRTLIDIRDAMDAYWKVAVRGKIGEVYNLGGKEPVTVQKVLKTLISFSNVKIKTQLDQRLVRPIDVTLQIPSSKKFYKHTKWKPKISLKYSLKALLNDIRSKYKYL